MRRVLSDSELKRLVDHQYSTGGCSFIDPLLQPYWSWLVTKIPLWLAPNLITVAGLAVNIVSSLVVIFYSPHATEHAPQWAYGGCAVGLFIYQTLDALDGKQARRTGTSSSLGEMFDHGCDALSTVIVSVTLNCALLLGNSPALSFTSCFLAMLLYYCAHWNAYITGTLPVNQFDVTESQLVIMVLHIVSAILGPDIWMSKIPNTEVRMNMLIAVGSILAILFVILKSLIVIQRGGQGKNGSTVANTSVLSPGIPMGFLLFTGCTLYLHSPTNLFLHHPCLFILTFGMSSSKIAINLVVAHVSKSAMPLVDSALLGPFLFLINLYFWSIINDFYLMLGTLVFGTFDLIYSSRSTCIQVCAHMKINCFTIAPNQAAK